MDASNNVYETQRRYEGLMPINNFYSKKRNNRKNITFKDIGKNEFQI